MNSVQLLSCILDRVGEVGQPVLFSFDDFQYCESSTIDQFIQIGLLKEEVKANTLICNGCEESCISPVETIKTNSVLRAFIICEVPEKQSIMGRVKVEIERLQQWQSSPLIIAKVVANLLGLDGQTVKAQNNEQIKIGMLKSKRGNRWISLIGDSLELELNNYRIPIEETLFFSGESLLIDSDSIEDILDRKPQRQNKEYTSKTDKREKRKAATKAMYEDWQQEFDRLRRKTPNRTNDWYARQISKLPIAQGRSSETIRRTLR